MASTSPHFDLIINSCRMALVNPNTGAHEKDIPLTDKYVQILKIPSQFSLVKIVYEGVIYDISPDTSKVYENTGAGDVLQSLSTIDSLYDFINNARGVCIASCC